MGRTANRRAANMANRAITVGELIRHSNASNLPQPPTVTCQQCGARWNANGLTVKSGICTCRTPFSQKHDID